MQSLHGSKLNSVKKNLYRNKICFHNVKAHVLLKRKESEMRGGKLFVAVIVSAIVLLTMTGFVGCDDVTACTHDRLTHTEAVSPSCTGDGNAEYWYCEDCGKYFPDAGATVEADGQSDFVIPATGHAYELVLDHVYHWDQCANCGDVTDKAVHDEDGENNGCTVCGAILSGTEGLIYAPDPDGRGYVLMSANGVDGQVTVPSFYDGKPVISIGKDAFNDVYDVTSVVIGNGIGSIGEYAFANCWDLVSVAIPESVTSVGESAFFNCISLESVEFSKGLKDIGQFAFAGCYSLDGVTIPSSVETIGSQAFGGCGALKELVISEGVGKIGAMAFSSCSLLTGVVIPASVSAIGGAAFDSCSALKELSVAVDSPYFKSENNIVYSKDGTVLVIYPQNDPAESFTIPSGVTAIGNSAFYGCERLKTVIIGECVTSIGNAAFAGCTLLARADLPEGLTVIGEDAFRDCASLTYVGIPSSVTSIGKTAFVGCKALSFVSVSEENGYYSSIDGDLYDKEASELLHYSQGKSNGVFTIRDGVKSVGDYAFYGCDSLTSVTMPDSLEKIGKYAFSGCKSLKNVSTGSGLTSIEERAFNGCSALEKFVVPASAYSIGAFAFFDCSSLAKVIFENAQGWFFVGEEGNIDIPPADLSDASAAAERLTDIFIGGNILRDC